MERLQFAVPTLFGLEGLCADEMRRLALPDVRAEDGRVLCAGAAGDLPPSGARRPTNSEYIARIADRVRLDLSVS